MATRRNRGRDYDRELALIERLDPDAHERIVERARAEGDEAFDRAIDRGAPSYRGCGRACVLR